jgi:oligopeptide transport system permease protein
MFFVILLVTYFGRSLLLLFVALGAVQWLTMSRIVRGQILTLKTQPFVEAARALGVRNRRIVLHHLIPNLLGPVIVYATLTVPVIMLEEAFLSFLGLGVSPPATSWGLLAAEGATAISIVRTNWWLIVFPGAALSITLFCLNFLGDGLRDALDPRHARRR